MLKLSKMLKDITLRSFSEEEVNAARFDVENIFVNPTNAKPVLAELRSLPLSIRDFYPGFFTIL